MNRTQIIFELAKYCHQDWYKKILDWKTEHLRALLEYYQRPEFKKGKSRILGVIEMGIGKMGIDIGEDEDVLVEFQWPIGYSVKDKEPLKNKMRFEDMRRKK